jgi:DNA-binding winged helix-turn-helix (wHTH) protein
MQQTIFVINDRFLVDVERSELLDKTTGENNRLEPRLMKLLQMLIEYNGRILKREYIIKEIWDDYPGANEGLNQAISFLRKLLGDEQKVIIQTQPKAGYTLKAKISKVNKHRLPFVRKYAIPLIGAICLLLLLFLGINIYLSKPVSSFDKQQLDEKGDVKKSSSGAVHRGIGLKRGLKDTLGPAANGDSLRKN